MTMQIETTRFGQIDVPEESVIHFPQELYGLHGEHDYCLLPHGDEGRFLWLQAMGMPALAMVVTDPFLYYPGYEVEISDEAAEILQARTVTDVNIYTTITVDADRQSIYTNLLGPLVINHQARLGLQLVQDGSRYTTQHPIGGRPVTREASGDDVAIRKADGRTADRVLATNKSR